MIMCKMLIFWGVDLPLERAAATLAQPQPLTVISCSLAAWLVMAAAAARKLQKDIEVVLKKGPFVAMAVEHGQVEKNMGNNGTKIKDLFFS